MGSKVLSKSFLKELAIYCRSRLVVWRIATLTFIVTAFSVAISRDLSLVSIILTFLLIVLLIAQFRLRDDLHDIPHDSLYAPDRVLVTSWFIPNYYFVLALFFIVIGAFLVMFRSTQQFAIYLIACAFMEFIYRFSNWKGAWRLLRNHIVILKYPAFLFICSPLFDIERFINMSGILYLILSIEDLATDKSIQKIKLTKIILFIEIIALITLFFIRIIL